MADKGASPPKDLDDLPSESLDNQPPIRLGTSEDKRGVSLSEPKAAKTQETQPVDTAHHGP